MKQTKKITILHSNDLHGDFLAEQVDEKLVGGVSMLSGYIEKVRAEQPNTIYVIAGDMFRGSVIDSEYKGLSTIEIMNALAPDVVTIGNHEVDYGIAHLLFIEKCARFPIINANLYIKNTSTRLFTPYKILRMDGMNILFIGIITQDVINQTKSESLVGSFVDTAAAAAEVGKICNAHNSIDIDFTVLLTHIGFEEDRHLARQLDPAWGVALIIGGHSHTYLEHEVEENGVMTPKMKISDNPAKVTNPGEKRIFRLVSKNNNKAIADVICLADEKIDESKPYTLIHPEYRWKTKEVRNFRAKELYRQIYKDGKLVYDLPDLKTIQRRKRESFDEFWDEYKRLEKPHIYKVDLSEKLYNLKQKLIDELVGKKGK